MTIIQNVECIDLICNPQDKFIPINSEVLRGKKILSIYVCGVPYNGPVTNPPRPKPFLDLSLIKELGLYLNLFDIQGNNFIKSLSCDNLIVDPTDLNFVELEINRVLDFDQCNLSYKAAPTITVPAKLRIYVMYQTHNFQPFSDEVNGSITFSLKMIDHSLSTVVGKTLDNKKIKKIIASENLGLLTLICKNNYIDQLDTLFLKINSPKEFYFDNIEIDFEKSYYDQFPLSSTQQAHYLQELTFIY